MADKEVFYYPKDRFPRDAYDPTVRNSVIKGHRWKINWFETGKERVETELDIIPYKEHFTELL